MAVGSRPLVPSRLAPTGTQPSLARGRRRTPWTVVGAYIALTKPRIIELLLITTVPTMVLAEGGWPPLGLLLVTLARRDAGRRRCQRRQHVRRPRHRRADGAHPDRPLVTGVIAPQPALVFALALEVAAFVVLWLGANLLSAVLALGAAAFYVGVYSLWLKRTSTRNIVIGGAAGAVPVLVGWAAVTDSLAWTPIILFAAIFCWTPPHFWALAIRYVDDYRAADVPMLPAVVPISTAARRMVGYTVAMIAATLVLVPVAGLGWIYTVAAVRPGRRLPSRHAALVRRPDACSRACGSSRGASATSRSCSPRSPSMSSSRRRSRPRMSDGEVRAGRTAVRLSEPCRGGQMSATQRPGGRLDDVTMPACPSTSRCAH